MSSTNTPQNADEFDIEVLAEKLYRVSKRALHKLFLPIRWMFARPLLLLLLVAAAAGCAYLASRVLPKSYEASFIIKPLNGGDLAFINMIKDLEALAGVHDQEQLANELNLDRETADRIHYISGEIVWKKPSDTVNIAIVTLRSADTRDFDTLQSAIIAYLESNPHYIKVHREQVERTRAFVKRIEAEINELDSTKEFLVRQTMPANAAHIVYGESPDLVKVHETILGLYGKELSLSAEIQRPGNFELLKPCVASSKPVFPRFGTLLAAFLAVAFLLAMAAGYRKFHQ